jgi:hypothetical protein
MQVQLHSCKIPGWRLSPALLGLCAVSPPNARTERPPGHLSVNCIVARFPLIHVALEWSD